MSVKTVLCQIKRAETPFYTELADLHIFSIEELCFFINHNLALIDTDFFDGRLTSWLRGELGLGDLAQKLEELMQEERPAVLPMILAVNAETDWLYVQDQDSFRKEIGRIQALPGPMRMQEKADTLAACGKYSRAIAVYKRILKQNPQDAALAGKAWHNMGVTYARLFQFDEACSCMERAFRLLGTDGALKDYLACVRISKGGDVYRKLADKEEAGQDIQAEIDRAFHAVVPKKKPDDIDEGIRRWVREYHHVTGL